MTDLFDALDREWPRLARSHHANHRLRPVLALADVADLIELEAYVRHADPGPADEILVSLVARAIGDDAIAARVLLQLLLPGTRRLANRWWALGDHDEQAAAAVTAVYGRIRNYPLSRRPGRVAANVLLDAGQDLRRAVPRLITTPTDDPDDLDQPIIDPGGSTTPTSSTSTAPSTADELTDLLRDAVAAHIITTTDAQLIARTRIAGHAVASIAAEEGLTRRTIWDRRHRAEATLVTDLTGAY